MLTSNISVFNFVFGILIGSFMNVCIYRIPLKQDIVYTPSHCFNCGKRVKWYDLIPILSYIALKGKCRHCRQKISIQYPIIELLHGVAYGWLYFHYGLSKELIFACALFSCLLVVAMIDFQHKIIPNGLIIIIGIIGLINFALDYTNALKYIIGFFAVSLLFLLIAILSKGKMGGGDIKLMAVAGLLLGWKNILVALMIGSLIGSIVGLLLIGCKIITRKQMIPFGPFLSIGIMVGYLYGDILIKWYIQQFI